MRTHADLPARESMKRRHKVRRFRRGNAEHGRAYLGHKQKPWKKKSNTDTTNTRSAVA